MEFDEAVLEHEEFEAPAGHFNTHDQAAETRAAKLKKLVSQVFLQAIELDHEQGMLMLESYQKEWAAIIEKSVVPKSNSLGDYLAFRTTKFRMRYIVHCEETSKLS
jgi:hypothetical protein